MVATVQSQFLLSIQALIKYIKNRVVLVLRRTLIMKAIVIPPRAYIVLGLACFIVGLLIILQENSLFGLVSQIAPTTQSVLVFGAVIQSIGQALVVFGFVKLNSNRLLSNFQFERQLTMSAFAKNVDQLQIRMQNERQSLMASYTQTMSKLDHLIAIQKELNVPPLAARPISCKYCGAKIEQGAFCLKCGKANF